MIPDPEYVTTCSRCGFPSDADPCEACQAPDLMDVLDPGAPDPDLLTIIVDRLPVVGGRCNGQTADASVEQIDLPHPDPDLAAAGAFEPYRRRPFIIGDPCDPELAHMVTVFHEDTPQGLGEAGAILRALVASIALLAGWAW